MCPGWSNMRVCNSAKYLGFFLGPCSSPLQWVKALSKYHARCGNIAAGHAPAMLLNSLYASRALPTLGYLAQLLEAPKDVKRIGLNSIIKVMRLATNSVSFDTAYALDTLGGPRFTNISVYLRSCLIRAACKTVTGHEGLQYALVQAATESLSFAQHKYKHAIPPGWDSQAYCTTLGKASAMLPQEVSSSAAGPKTSLQARIFNAIAPGQSSKNLAWRKLLGDRVSNLCSDDLEDNDHVLNESELQKIVTTLLLLDNGPRLCVIKTFINSWTTSCRMGESIDLPCFFCGEDMEDDLIQFSPLLRL